jgi:hypothetical protein
MFDMKKASLAKFFAFSQLLLFLIFSVPVKVWAQDPIISSLTPANGNPGQVLLFHRYVKNRSL